jgi:hypothetical protein
MIYIIRSYLYYFFRIHRTAVTSVRYDKQDQQGKAALNERNPNTTGKPDLKRSRRISVEYFQNVSYISIIRVLSSVYKKMGLMVIFYNFIFFRFFFIFQ